MKYIIMCGGVYHHLDFPKQLFDVNGETLVGRTIRLLRENGITDIYISSDNPVFDHYAPRIQPREAYSERWIDGAFPVLGEEVCYIFGDVLFSPAAIKTIVETETDDVEFFASAGPYPPEYIKTWAEPFAFKVKDFKHFAWAIEETKELYDQGLLDRCVSWELWQVIKHTDLNNVIVNYTAIRDYSCDIDYREDLERIREATRGIL